MVTKERKAALYVRVSTDHQTVQNQIDELTAIAKRRGWEIVETYQDAGISGAKGRDQRPALDQMLKDASRGKFDVVMAVAIDRLGRSLIDLLRTIQHLEECGADIFVDKQALDTTTPMGKLMFQVCGAFAEFERHMIRQRVNAGLKRARTHGTKSGNPFGRPPLDPKIKQRVEAALAKGGSIRAVAAAVGTSHGTVQRIREEMAG